MMREKYLTLKIEKSYKNTAYSLIVPVNLYVQLFSKSITVP